MNRERLLKSLLVGIKDPANLESNLLEEIYEFAYKILVDETYENSPLSLIDAEELWNDEGILGYLSDEKITSIFQKYLDENSEVSEWDGY
jgi:hypothetical protein